MRRERLGAGRVTVEHDERGAREDVPDHRDVARPLDAGADDRRARCPTLDRGAQARIATPEMAAVRSAVIGLASITATGTPVTGSLSSRVAWIPGRPQRRVRRVAHDPFHADEVAGPGRVVAREVGRHRMPERAVGPRVDADLGRQLGVAGEPPQGQLRERQALVGGGHRGNDVGPGEIPERAGWMASALLVARCRAAPMRARLIG